MGRKKVRIVGVSEILEAMAADTYLIPTGSGNTMAFTDGTEDVYCTYCTERRDYISIYLNGAQCVVASKRMESGGWEIDIPGGLFEVKLNSISTQRKAVSELLNRIYNEVFSLNKGRGDVEVKKIKEDIKETRGLIEEYKKKIERLTKEIDSAKLRISKLLK